MLDNILKVLSIIFLAITGFCVLVFLSGCECIYDQGYMIHAVVIISIELWICKYCIRILNS